MRGFTYLDDRNWIERNILDGFRAVERPISDSQCRKAARWMKGEFGEVMDAACEGTPFPAPLLAAMVCQETAYFWLKFIDEVEAGKLLERCVLDASGDAPGAPRNARPRNTREFRRDFGGDFTELLIGEANATRAMRGFGPKQWVYKGYGIFQYDLQFVYDEADFYRNKKWYRFDECLSRALSELKRKYAITHDLWEAVRAYNGSGVWAERYRDNVKHFYAICKDVWQVAPADA